MLSESEIDDLVHFVEDGRTESETDLRALLYRFRPGS